jgi:hypothetical protein
MSDGSTGLAVIEELRFVCPTFEPPAKSARGERRCKKAGPSAIAWQGPPARPETPAVFTYERIGNAELQ